MAPAGSLQLATLQVGTEGRGFPRPFREWLLGHEQAQKQIYGWMIWLGQVSGLRYSEWITTEWPMDGPRFRVDFAAGKIYVTGKGRLGGKTRSVTITPEREAGLRRLAVWRENLGEKLANDGVAVAPSLFPNLAPRHRRGSPRNPDVAAWNHTVRKYVRAYNRRCTESGRSALVLDTKLVSSHKIGRPVHITSLALARVDDKVAMEETGIEDERTLARYKRFSDSERREMLSKVDQISSGHSVRDAPRIPGGPREILELLKQQAPPGNKLSMEHDLAGSTEPGRRRDIVTLRVGNLRECTKTNAMGPKPSATSAVSKYFHCRFP